MKRSENNSYEDDTVKRILDDNSYNVVSILFILHEKLDQLRYCADNFKQFYAKVGKNVFIEQ